MKPFLEYVADDLLAKYGTNLSRLAVVFPNKRASLFLNEHLARKAQRPLWSPHYITISELFRQYSQRQVADPIKLVSDLHKSFTRCTGIDETLDHFYGWGQLLLSDFDDVDKNMAPPDRVFANLRDVHELDDTSYLTPEQQQALRQFFSNFSADHNTELKRRFLQLWSHIGDIYHDYNRLLASQQLAYEGALYREVAELSDIPFHYDTYVFIGFNMLQQVEQQLFTRLKNQGRAKFYWDFDDYYLTGNEAGHFIAQYLALFPNELDSHNPDIYHNLARHKDVSYISAPTENIQARYISTWLRQNQRIEAGRQTAVVLCDETLLQTAIHCLPPEVERLNITTGYPLAQTPVASLVSLLINQETAGYDRQRRAYRLHHVNRTLRHPHVQSLAPLYPQLYDWLNTQHVYYPKPAQLADDSAPVQLFPALADADTGEPFNLRLLHWLLNVIRRIGMRNEELEMRNDDYSQGGKDSASKGNHHSSFLIPHSSFKEFFAESLFRMYTLLNRLASLTEAGDLEVDTITLQRLAAQIVDTTTIPFHGEPIEGTQLMGVLETRNLDFQHLLLLSCNEGNLPRGISDTSFIPYTIRRAYGLTTADHKVAIYAYYFHRLLQRADDITIVYNNATTDGQTGEPSRFMLQLMVERRQPIHRLTLQAGQQPYTSRPQPIAKNNRVEELLRQRFAPERGGISPSAINTYLRCPLQFYYHYVAGITEPDTPEQEDISDNRIFGNIFHQAAQIVYQRLTDRSRRILASDIDELLRSQVDIERAVDEAFRQQLFQITDPARPLPPLDGLQLINREVIIRYVRQLLQTDRRLAPFTIIGLEKRVKMDITVNAPIELCSPFPLSRLPVAFATRGAQESSNLIAHNSYLNSPFHTTLGGFIDRLDAVTMPDGTERIRVVDYKTGSSRLKPLATVEAIFMQESLKDHSDYYLQTFLYSHIVSLSAGGKPVSPALLFIQHAAADDYDPTLCLGKEPVADIADVARRFMELLQQVLDDIFAPDRPFLPTADRQRCRHCPYAALCGSPS